MIDKLGWFITPSKETTFSELVFLFKDKPFTTALVEEDGGFLLPDSIFTFFLIREEMGGIKVSEYGGFMVECMLDSEGEGEFGITTSSVTRDEFANHFLCKRSSIFTSRLITVSTGFLPNLFQIGLKPTMPRVTSSGSAHLT